MGSLEIQFEGEYPPISERLLIAPARGRLHHHRVRAGRYLEPGTVIGELRTLGGRVQLRSRLAGTFLAWIAPEGESVILGQALAIVRPADDESRSSRSSTVHDLRSSAGHTGPRQGYAR